MVTASLSRLPIGSASPARAGGAAIWFASRLLAGMLGLLQVELVTQSLGATGAGRFFLLWTAAWLLAVALKFGADGLLPRIVAEAQLVRAPKPSLRRILVAGGVTALAATPVVFAILRLPLDLRAVAVALGLAGCWAGTLICTGLLQAHGRVALSGIVGNVLWQLGPSLAPLLMAHSHSWLRLGVLTFDASLVGLALSLAVTAAVLGRGIVGRVVAVTGRSVPLDSDTIGSAVLSVLWQAMVWMPVVFAGLAGVDGAYSAAIFAATRIVGLFSWGYSSIVAVVTPRIAGALAARDVVATRQLLLRAAGAGALVTAPACALGIVFARPLIGSFDASYETATGVLTLLILTRLLDALTGPLGEALVVGRRNWLDAAIVSSGIAAGAVVALTLLHPLGTIAIGIGVTVALVLINVLRLGAVARLLAQGWPAPADRPDRRGAMRARVRDHGRALGLGLATVATAGAVGLHFVGEPPLWTLWLATAASGILICAIACFAVGTGQRRHLATSPLAIVAFVLIAQFGLRPATLVVDPSSATWGLRLIGFYWADVIHAATLGIAGLGVLTIGFMVCCWPGAIPAATIQRLPDVPTRQLVRRLLAVTGLGSLMWTALFLRNGGIHVLLDDPSALHLGQYGTPYGLIGLMICFGAALAALWAWLRRPERALAITGASASAAGVAGSVALATRSALVVSALAAVALLLRDRRPSRRTVLWLATISAIGALGLCYARAFRANSQTESTAAAVHSTLRTDPLQLISPDFIEFDHLVALQRLVPGDLGWLRGQSFREIAAVFVPRGLWAKKPLPIDFTLARALYGAGGTDAGTPFTLPGEMYWNFGIVGALEHLLGLGALAGAGWRLLRRSPRPTAELALALLFGNAYLLLTRPLGQMVLQSVAGIAAAAFAWYAAVLDVSVLRGIPARARRAVALRPRRRPPHPRPAAGAGDSAGRFVAGDPLRGLAAVAVLLVHVANQASVTHHVVLRNASDYEHAIGWAGAVMVPFATAPFLFFALSGYLIGRPFVRAFVLDGRYPSLRTYALHRARRIIPAFWVAAALTLFLLGAQGSSFTQVLAVFGCSQIYDPSVFSTSIGQAWTLHVEVVFYLALPIAFLALRRLSLGRPSEGRRIAIVLALTGALTALGVSIAAHNADSTTAAAAFPSAAFSFMPGIALAALELVLPGMLVRFRWTAGFAFAIGALGLLALVLAGDVEPLDQTSRHWLIAIGVGALVTGPLLLQWGRGRCWRWLDSAPLHWVGQRSYSFYVLHLLVLAEITPVIAATRTAKDGFLIGALPVLVLSLVGAELSYRWVELPFLRRRSRPRPHTNPEVPRGRQLSRWIPSREELVASRRIQLTPVPPIHDHHTGA